MPGIQHGAYMIGVPTGLPIDTRPTIQYYEDGGCESHRFLPLWVVSLTGSHPKSVSSYGGEPSFFVVSSILNKAAFGIRIRLPTLMDGISPLWQPW